MQLTLPPIVELLLFFIIIYASVNSAISSMIHF